MTKQLGKIGVSYPIEKRFWRFVEKTNYCWNWIGAKTSGYGAIGLGDRILRAHRISFEMVKGKIPDGLQIDHLCRNRSCVNPDHLEAVTQAENIRRGEGISVVHAKRTHCNYGHLFSIENTAILHGYRRCKTCHRESEKRRNKWLGKIREKRRNSLAESSTY